MLGMAEPNKSIPENRFNAVIVAGSGVAIEVVVEIVVVEVIRLSVLT